MKKFKALKAVRNVSVSLSNGKCFLSTGDEIPSDYISISQKEMDILSINPAFEIVKESKKLKNEL